MDTKPTTCILTSTFTDLTTLAVTQRTESMAPEKARRLIAAATACGAGDGETEALWEIADTELHLVADYA